MYYFHNAQKNTDSSLTLIPSIFSTIFNLHLLLPPYPPQPPHPLLLLLILDLLLFPLCTSPSFRLPTPHSPTTPSPTPPPLNSSYPPPFQSAPYLTPNSQPLLLTSSSYIPVTTFPPTSSSSPSFSPSNPSFSPSSSLPNLSMYPPPALLYLLYLTDLCLTSTCWPRTRHFKMDKIRKILYCKEKTWSLLLGFRALEFPRFNLNYYFILCMFVI